MYKRKGRRGGRGVQCNGFGSLDQTHTPAQSSRNSTPNPSNIEAKPANATSFTRERRAFDTVTS